MTEFMHRRGRATILRSGLLQLQIIRAARFAVGVPGGFSKTADGIMPLFDASTLRKLERNVDHFWVAWTCQRLTETPSIMIIALFDGDVSCWRARGTNRAISTKIIKMNDRKATLSRAAYCAYGKVKPPTQNDATARLSAMREKVTTTKREIFGARMHKRIARPAPKPSTAGRLQPTAGM
jgi:hypothetical protein